jgi:hypothetical protein
MKRSSNTIIIIFATLLLTLVVVASITQLGKEMFRESPTKCFSCERQFPSEYQWLGRNTRCFSCERDLVRRTGNPSAGSLAQPIKYY